MIRKAELKDIPRILQLLEQVALVHHNGRPDIFKKGRKYSASQIQEILGDKNKVILIATDKFDNAVGYSFCVFIEHKDDELLADVKTLYIDDLCVDESCRGKGIGKRLYNASVDLARERGCYNLTLNVWNCNPSAMAFYNQMGLTPQKIGLEKIL